MTLLGKKVKVKKIAKMYKITNARVYQIKHTKGVIYTT